MKVEDTKSETVNNHEFERQLALKDQQIKLTKEEYQKEIEKIKWQQQLKDVSMVAKNNEHAAELAKLRSDIARLTKQLEAVET